MGSRLVDRIVKGRRGRGSENPEKEFLDSLVGSVVTVTWMTPGRDPPYLNGVLQWHTAYCLGVSAKGVVKVVYKGPGMVIGPRHGEGSLA